MDAARWARVRSILEAALDAPPELRLDTARRLASGPDELAEVAALLNADADALPRPAARAAVDDLLEAYESARLVGLSFDGLTLTRFIGAGGMGEVFEARRDPSPADPHPRPVAVKLIRRGVLTPGARRRFAAERAALARLSHPNIASLLGGGEVMGRPYIVLELVNGLPLLEYCAAHALPILDRVTLLRDACLAVAHAHQNLIVHRDLKPANILITPSATPKLLDFGVAKLLGSDADAPTLTRLLTPRYASPEQLRGEPVTTASDVFSLGLILYDLLSADAAPADPDDRDRPTTTRPRLGADFEPPSRLVPGLDPELDAIALLALAPEPARRYPSAEAMAADLDRYLSGEPVRAMAASRAYRARKWVRRHRIGVTLIASLALFLTGAAIVASTAAVRLQSERRRTIAAQRDAERVSQILGDLVAGAGQSALDGSLSLAAMLDRAAHGLESDAAGTPAVTGPVHAALASAYHAMGHRDRALAHFDAALADHLVAFGDDDPRTWNVREAYARALTLDGNFGHSERLWNQSLAARARFQGPDHPNLARPLHGLGHCRMIQGDFAAAATHFRNALRLSLPTGSPAAIDTLISLGAVAIYDGRPAEGVEHRTRAVELSRRLHGPDSLETADAVGALGEALISDHRPGDAIPILRDAVDLVRRIRGPARAAASRPLRALAWALEEAGHPAEAEQVFLDAAAALTDALPTSRHDLVYLRENYARFLVRAARDAEARPLFAEAADTYRNLLGPDHLRTTSARAEVEAIDARAQGTPATAPQPPAKRRRQHPAAKRVR